MLKYKLSPLIQKTAKDLKHSPALVEAVINHQFDFIRKQVLDPDPNVIGLRLEDLGKFY